MSEWTANKGFLPVPEGTLVHVRHRDGDEYGPIPAGESGGYAEDWSLEHEGADILMWRLGEKNRESRRIHVCTYCGSPRIFADAWASMNTDEVRTYDANHCDDCEGECSTTEVEVPDGFDLETDFYKETK